MKFPRSFSLANATLGVLTLSLGLSLVACGSDSSSSKDDGNKTPDGIDQFESMDDLVHCTKSHFGEVAYVTEKDSIYECTSEGWVVADSAKVEEILSSSDSKDDGKSSGSKDDSGDSDEKSSSSEKASAEDTVKVEVVKVDSVKVTGLAQKGPFTSGSAVTLYGLDSSFARTKTKFTGKVAGDSGRFSIEKIALGSQYAELEVNGFYKNALTGKNTSGTKTKLSALVDLSAGKDVKANVNLFTEFEKARALQLVKKEKYNVPAAKMRASREIVNVFGNVYGGKKIDSASVPSATSISLSDTGSVGAALYAAGVMMTQNLSVSKSASLIGDVAEDIAADGSWNSDTSRAAVADNLCAQDSVDGFAAARTNLMNMKLAASVPNFESNLRYFWNEVYGLGECTEELETAETIRKVTNKQSDNYGAGFACTSRRWHKVTALDTELGMCTSKMEGQYRESNLSKNTEYYTCKQGTWAKISEIQYNLKECTDEIAKSTNPYKKAATQFFLCTNNEWKEITSVDFDLKMCDEKRRDELAELDGSYFVCKDDEWKKISALDYELKICDEDSLGIVRKDLKNSSESFICAEDGWRKTVDPEDKIGLCLQKNNGTFKKSSDADFYECVDMEWIKVSELDYEFEERCSSDNYEAKRKTETDSYLCGKEGWVTVGQYEYVLGFCDEIGTKESVLGTYVKCSDLGWMEITQGEYENGPCSAELDNKVISNSVCLGGEWRVARPSEIELESVCNETNKGQFQEKNGKTYLCNGADWHVANKSEIASGKECSEKLLGTRTYYLEDGVYHHSFCEKYGTAYAWSVRAKSGVEDGEYKWSHNGGLDSSSYRGIKIWKFEDTRDNSKYDLVPVGSQIWFAENLHYEGVRSCSVVDDAAYYYVGSTSSEKDYCPDGFHVASGDDWYTLISYTETIEHSSSVEGYKSTSFGGNNKFGLNILGKGRYYSQGKEVVEKGDYAYFAEPREVSVYSSGTIKRENDQVFSYKEIRYTRVREFSSSEIYAGTKTFVNNYCGNGVCIYSKQYEFSMRCVMDDALLAK